MANKTLSASLICIFLLAACATIRPDLPSITEEATGNRHVGKVVWHDLLTNTPAESRRFYSELFGWTFENPGIDLGFGDAGSYMLIRHNGNLIGGMVDTNALGKTVNVSQWMTMISVADIEAAVARASADGGTILTPPAVLESRGTLAIIKDPSGALFVLIQTRDGDPADREPALNDFLWNELWTDDVDRASDFYGQVVGYRREDEHVARADRTYHLLKTGDRPRAGILANPFEQAPPVWINYVRVEDPAAIASRVEALGGEILVDAQPRAIGGTVAFIAGPSGAGVALQTWPLK